MTHLLESPSPTDICDELQQLVLNDLLGPAGGEEEEVNELYVRERYLVGMLAPQKRPVGDDAFEELALGGTGTDEDGTTDVSAPQAPTLFPSSFGMTFTMAANTTVIHIMAGWGR